MAQKFTNTSPARATTLTATKRARFPARFARKDARTLALRLAYGPQSNTTNQVTVAPAYQLAMAGSAELQAARASLLSALVHTGYDAGRCQEILVDFDRLRKVAAPAA